MLKDTFVLDRIAPDLKKYRDWITDNADRVVDLTAQEVKARLLDIEAEEKRRRLPVAKPDEINFLSFCDDYLTKMENTELRRNARPLRTVYNSLKDYFKSDYVPITKIRYQFLLLFGIATGIYSVEARLVRKKTVDFQL